MDSVKIPQALSILATNKCNFNCYYCEFDCKLEGTSLGIDLLKKILHQGSQLRIRRVVYDGGEPMLYEHFEELLKLSHKYNYKTGFVTNGWFIPEKFDLLRKYKVDDFWIGIDGMDAETNDKIRGKKGSFKRIMESVDLIKENGMFAALNFIVLKENYKQVKKLIEFAAKNEINGMQIINLNKYAGRAYKNNVQGLSPKEESYVRETVNNYTHLLNIKINTGYLNNKRVSGLCKYLSLNQLCFDWNGSCLLCAITPEVNVGRLPFPSIQKDNFSDVLKKINEINKKFTEIRDKEFMLWKPEETHSSCGYCLERLRTDPSPFFEQESEETTKYKKMDGDLLLTTSCPTECEFCIYGCKPEGEWMPENTIERVAEEYTKNDVGIRIGGGEPFYDLEKLERCLDIVLKYQKPHEVLVITSGFFGSSKELTRKALKILTDRKLDTLVVSTDRFHLKWIPLSSIINIINEAKKQKLKIILRVTQDERSYGLMDKLAEIIVEHQVKFEPHEQYGVYGKAELLDPSLRNNAEKRKEYFNKKIVEFAMKYKKSAIVKDYEEQSPKRSQRKFASKFYPTTFPNGNVYADSQCAKGSFMGNINEESLKNLIDKFSKTLPGYILWSEKSSCPVRMKRLLPSNIDDTCDYCRNQPLAEEIQKEAIGRYYTIINIGDDFDKLLEKLKKPNRELLLSFNLNEKDLNQKTGKKIIGFLSALKNAGVRFKISKPLPRCLFGMNYINIAKELGTPRNCYECSELFSVVNEAIVSCKPINKKGPNIYYMEDRNQIWEFFNILRLQKEPGEKCKKCSYFMRKFCDGLCFRR